MLLASITNNEQATSYVTATAGNNLLVQEALSLFCFVQAQRLLKAKR